MAWKIIRQITKMHQIYKEFIVSEPIKLEDFIQLLQELRDGEDIFIDLPVSNHDGLPTIEVLPKQFIIERCTEEIEGHLEKIGGIKDLLLNKSPEELDKPWSFNPSRSNRMMYEDDILFYNREIIRLKEKIKLLS